jgi:hypothetical protein
LLGHLRRRSARRDGMGRQDNKKIIFALSQTLQLFAAVFILWLFCTPFRYETMPSSQCDQIGRNFAICAHFFPEKISPKIHLTKL